MLFEGRLIKRDEANNYWGFSKFLAGVFLLSYFNNAAAQVNKSLHTVQLPSSYKQKNAAIIKENCPDSLNNIIQGRVLDAESMQPIKNATVSVADSSISCTTDSNGIFNILIPEKLITDSIMLTIQKSYEYYTDIVVYKKEMPVSNKIIYIRESRMMMLGGAVSYCHTTKKKAKKWWKFWK